MDNPLSKIKVAYEAVMSKCREEKKMMEDKTFCALRKDDTPIFIKPVRLRTPKPCALTGRLMTFGEFAYPAIGIAPNLKLWPYGHLRVDVDEAQKRMGSPLPKDMIVMQIPTFDQIVSRAGPDAEKQRKMLELAGSALLREGKRE